MLSWVGNSPCRDIHPIPDNIPGGTRWDYSPLNRSNRRSRGHTSRDFPRARDIALKRSARFTSAIRTALVLVCPAVLVLVVGADVPLSLQPPSEVILCQLINLTWSGGTPPYRLDVEPLVDNLPNKTANVRKIGVDNTWFLWTPDFPPGALLQISIVGSGTAPAASVHATELSSSNSSCLNTTSATSPVPTSTSQATSLSASPDQPSATSSSAILTSSRSRLGRGAIAGIAVASTFIGIGLIAFIAWYLLRLRSRGQHPEKGGYGRTVASPIVPYSDPSSTLVSEDRHKLTSPMSTLGSSSDTPADRDPLRPTPYPIAHPTSTSSTAKMSKSMCASDVRETIASPPQLGPADSQDAGDGGGDGDEDVTGMRFDASRAPPPSRSLGLGFGDAAASDVASNSGEATLPPPYSALLGGRRDEPA